MVGRLSAALLASLCLPGCGAAPHPPASPPALSDEDRPSPGPSDEDRPGPAEAPPTLPPPADEDRP